MRTLFAILSILALLLSFSCKEDHQHQTASSYYTCPMHPSVRSDKPGACPVCNMALVKVQLNDKNKQDHSNMVMLDNEKRALAHIITDTVRSTAINAQTTLVGTVSANENNVATITARVKGRIDQLFIRQEGERIVNSQPLYSIYSEELLADQNDYLSTFQQLKKFPGQEATINKMIDGGRQKLFLWGMTELQIKKLETTRQASALLTYYSAYSGFVSKLLINEGEYTEIGKPLFQITDLRSVWIETQVYANEIQYLHANSEASITVEGLPQKTFKGRVVFYNPALEENSKINLVRFRIENDHAMIKPGMMARVTIDYHEKQTLAIPKGALLIGRMKMVWIEVEPGMFESRTVETGIENKKFVEILSGLKEGELIVTSGAYLLNSEFILKQGAVKAHDH